MRTFQEAYAARHAGAGLREGRERINDFIRSKGPRRSTQDGRDAQQAGRELAAVNRQLDQGSRAGPMPPPTDSNAAANAYLRAAFRHEPLEGENGEDCSTEA